MGMIKLNEFYSAFTKNNVLADNQFKFTLILPLTGADQAEVYEILSNNDELYDGVVFSTYLRECELPVKDINTSIVDFNGYQVVFPRSINRNEQELELDMLVDSQMKNFMFIQRWIDYMNMTDNPDNQGVSALGNKPLELSGDPILYRLGGGVKKIPLVVYATIEMFDKDHVTLLATYTFHGIFPTTCSNIKLNNGRSELVSINTKWSYQYWTVENYLTNNKSD